MSESIDFLIRKSLEVRSIQATHFLLSHALVNPPSLRRVERISREMGRGEAIVARRQASYELAGAPCLGSEALLRRQLQTGQHYLKGEAFHAACASVALAA